MQIVRQTYSESMTVVHHIIPARLREQLEPKP